MKPLETFQYEHITFFGASQSCTYKIIVDEREMFFETPLVRLRILKDRPMVSLSDLLAYEALKTSDQLIICLIVSAFICYQVLFVFV